MPVHRIAEFDLWRPGYAGAIVTVFVAGTTARASLFSDEGLQVAIANPQTLDTMALGGTLYGKFLSTVYTSSPYELDIDGQQTGIERPPLTNIVGQDASAAIVTATGGSVAHTLADISARVVYANDHGALGTSSAVNHATLTAAIGVASAAGAGVVVIPGGSFPFTALTLPGGVVLRGEGRGSTVLQCQSQGDCITIGGDRAGLRMLTLDGIDLQANSVGVFSKANNETIFDDVLVKRFNTGLYAKGGRRAQWQDLSIENCATGAKLHGDSDSGGGADGDQYRDNTWQGGLISLCTGVGIDLSYEDRKCIHNFFNDIGFEDNTGTALRVYGARYTHTDNSWWSGNTVALSVQDDTDMTVDDNTVIGLHLQGGGITGGEISFEDTCQDVIIEKMALSDVDFTLTTPGNAILVLDCTEDPLVTISGDGTKFTRWRSTLKGEAAGQTTDASATKAWSIRLDPGQVGLLEAKVCAVRRDGITGAVYHKAVKVKRPGSTLAYDTQVANFTVGEILTGTNSGATALITADTDSGATGTLTLREIAGAFENNEQITDPQGGDALANGTLSAQDVVIDQADTLGTDDEDVVGWDAVFVANVAEIELRVTGAASTIVDWIVHVETVLVG